MVALVTGFPSKVSALQFEHALQHPYQTRHIQLVKRVSLLKTLGTSIHHKLANIRLLVESKFFSNFQLTIMIINDIKKEWNQNKFNLTSKHALFCESIENEVVPSRSVYYEEFKAKIIKDCPINCRFCTKVIDYVSEQPEVPIRTRLELDSFFKRGSLPLLACTPCDCKVISHLSCLAKFAANKEKVQIIPQQVSCPDCNGDMNWIDTVRVSTKLREYFLST